MRTLFCVLTALLLLIPFGIATAQDPPCGDVDGDGRPGDIGDIMYLMQYLCGNLEIDTANADFDIRVGVTVADASAMAHLESKAGAMSQCNPTEEYSFDLSPPDTIYIPYISGIAADVTQVFLPIAMTLSDAYKTCFYLPIRNQAAGSSNTFEFSQTHYMDESLSFIPYWSYPPLADTVVLAGVSFWGGVQGNRIWFSLEYQRTNAGEGAIVTDITDRYDPLKYAVGRSLGGELNIDLFRPVVVPVDVSFPMGDCDCSGSLDIADLVCIIEHLFDFGPTCQPYVQPYSVHILDVGCTGSVDISDLVYFVDYMFNGGPPPCDPFAP